MPLSEQEQKLLEEMERSLYRNDADFVSAVSGAKGRLHYGSVVLGILLAVVGLAVVVLGVVFKLLLLGVLGFAVMFVGVLVALRRSKKLTGLGGGRTASAGGSARSGSTKQGGSLMDRLNDRWEHREENRD